MKKHTKGPWFVKKCSWCEEGLACSITSKSDDEYYDADILGSDNRDECTHIMNEANAKLIAAAPDLLEACKRISKASYGVALGDLEFLNLAIAKAISQRING